MWPHRCSVSGREAQFERLSPSTSLDSSANVRESKRKPKSYFWHWQYVSLSHSFSQSPSHNMFCVFECFRCRSDRDCCQSQHHLHCMVFCCNTWKAECNGPTCHHIQCNNAITDQYKFDVMESQLTWSLILVKKSSVWVTAYFLCNDIYTLAFLRKLSHYSGKTTHYAIQVFSGRFQRRKLSLALVVEIKHNMYLSKFPSNPLNSIFWFLLLILSEHIWALGVKYGTIFQYGRRQSVNTNAGAMEWFQRLFLAYEWRRWEVRNGERNVIGFHWHFKNMEHWRKMEYVLLVETNYYYNLL